METSLWGSMKEQKERNWRDVEVFAVEENRKMQQ